MPNPYFIFGLIDTKKKKKRDYILKSTMKKYRVCYRNSMSNK